MWAKTFLILLIVWEDLADVENQSYFLFFFFLYWILEYDDPGPNKYSGFTTLWTSVIVIIILSLVKEYFAITFHNYKKPINVNLPMNSDTNSVTK